MGPPDFTPLNFARHLPRVLIKGLQLGAMQSRIQLRTPMRVHFIEPVGDGVALLPVQELRKRGGEQSTSRYPEATGSRLGLTEKVVGYGHSGLHAFSITKSYTGQTRVPARCFRGESGSRFCEEFRCR